MNKGLALALWFGLAAAAPPPAFAEGPKVEVVPPIGHQTEIRDIAISPDGRFLATAGGSDTTAKLWDYATGKVLRTFQGHSDSVGVVAFTPDSKSLITGSTDKTLRRWDIATGALLETYEGYSAHIRALAFSPDGKTMVAGDDDGRVKLWSLATGAMLQDYFHRTKYDYQPLVVASFSADGDSVVAIHADATRTWNLSSDGIDTMNWGRDTGNDLPIAKAISPDGRYGVGFRMDSHEIRLWNLTTDEPNVTIGVGILYAAEFTPDGRFILTGAEDGTLSLYDRGKAALVRRFGAGAPISAIAFTPDGHEAAVVGKDNAVVVWDVQAGEKVRTIEAASDSIVSAVVSADGTRVFSSGKSVRLWDKTTGATIRSFAGAGEIALSTDESRILTEAPVGNAVSAFDVDSGTLLRTFDRGSRRIQALAISGDGKVAMAATFEDDNLIHFWDVDTGKQLRILNTKSVGPVRVIAFSPDGKIAFANGETIPKGTMRTDSYLRLWDAGTRKAVKTLKHPEPPISVAVSRDGARVLTGDWYGAIRLFDVKSGRLLREFDVGTDVLMLAFSEDGRLAFSGGQDNILKLWDLEAGTLVQTFIGHAGHIRAVHFEPDGRQLVSIGGDGTLRHWDRATGQLLTTMVSFTNGEWVKVTPEGFFDASPRGAEQLTVVRGLDFYSIDQVYQALYRPDLVAAKLAGDPDGKVRDAAAKLDLNKVIESGGAPRVAIVSPVGGASLDADSVEVEATVTDQGGGVGKIEWRVNGVTLGIDARGFDRLAIDAGGANGSGGAGPGKTVTMKQKLSLDPGENRIEVVAYNAKGLIASDPVEVTVRWEGASAATAPKLYVLAVGVNDYWDSRLQLTYAAPDARAIGEAFRKGGGKLYDSVEVTTVLDAAATAANLDKVFADLGTKVRPRDVFVFFLAGHGKTEDGRYYFLPQDFRYEDAGSIAKGGIDQDRFQAWFAQIKARKSVLLYDTCDSGSLTGSLASRGLEEVAALARMTRAMGRTVLSASTDDAPALEGYRNHGVFTYAVLEALGGGDKDRNGLIEVTELAGAIDKSVPEISFAAFKLRQVPQMSIVGSDFALASQVAVLPAEAAGGAIQVPATPTHVVIVTANVREAADESAPLVVELTPGGQVRLIRTEAGWSLIARDGKQLGYVQEGALAAMH